MPELNKSKIHATWKPIVEIALKAMDANYLKSLTLDESWLPGYDAIFNAFSLPLNKVHFILFGESPYPRTISANGHAFWDAAVKNVWSDSGLAKPVNRATSLR